MKAIVIPNASTKDVRKIVMDGRQMRILPASVWQSLDWLSVRMLLHETGTYVIPTEELIDYLDNLIGQDYTIEIGAGNGWIGRELDIMMTDSYQQQDDEATVMLYRIMGQPTIRYPKDVIKIDANAVARRFKPHTILGCYVTHKWRNDIQDGNYKGVDFEKLLRYVKRLILVGNIHTHRTNPIMDLPHKEVYFDGLMARANDQTTNRIFIWETE